MERSAMENSAVDTADSEATAAAEAMRRACAKVLRAEAERLKGLTGEPWNEEAWKVRSGAFSDAADLLDRALGAPITTALWRPMSEAPKNRRILLNGCTGGPEVDIGQWGTGRYERSRKEYRQAWVTTPGHEQQPTGWMELPASDAENSR
jgi:hypothetical protein